MLQGHSYFDVMTYIFHHIVDVFALGCLQGTFHQCQYRGPITFVSWSTVTRSTNVSLIDLYVLKLLSHLLFMRVQLFIYCPTFLLILGFVGYRGPSFFCLFQFHGGACVSFKNYFNLINFWAIAIFFSYDIDFFFCLLKLTPFQNLSVKF